MGALGAGGAGREGVMIGGAGGRERRPAAREGGSGRRHVLCLEEEEDPGSLVGKIHSAGSPG